MTHLARGAATALVLAYALLAGTADTVLAADTGVCPSFTDLGRRIDAKITGILALQPGLPLEEFTKEHAFRALNFWDDVGSDRETVFFVVVSEGNAQVSDELECRFDRTDRLRACRRECCRDTTRTITEAQYSAIAIGESRLQIERRLCPPSDAEVDPKNAKRVSIHCHIDLPIGHHDEGQTVTLVFEDGKLTSKGMSPY